MRLICLLLVIMSLVACAEAQVEQGDTEVLFSGFLASTYVGSSSSQLGSFQLSVGHFFTKNLQLGIGPMVTVRSVTVTLNQFGVNYSETDTDVILSGTAFININLLTNGRVIPFVRSTWYQMDFSPDEPADFTDFSYITAGAGVRIFTSRNIALVNSLDYGFSLADAPEGFDKPYTLTLQVGLSAIF